MVRNWKRLSRSAASADAAARSARRAIPDEIAERRPRSAPGACRPAAASRPPRGRRKTIVPKTRRIGWAKLPAVYWVAGLGSGKPQSQAGARRTAREAKRWMAKAASDADSGDEDEDQQAVVGAAALGDRHDRQPGQRGLRPACARRPGLRRPAPGASMTTPGQDAGEQAEGRRESTWRRARTGRPRCAVGGRGAARPAEEGDAVGLDEAGGGERGRQRQHGADRRHQDLQAPLRQVGAEQDRLEGQPFGDEAVQRRQRGDRDAADEEDERGLRHAVDEAAEPLHVALAGRGQHGAGAEEEQALEERMVEDVEQRRGQRQRRGRRHAVGVEGERQAEADEDDADVLDRR